MLTLVVDGKRHKVPVLDPFIHTRGSHHDWLSYKARRDAEAGLNATTSRKSVTGCHEPWSTKEDHLLAKLLAFRTSWSRIALAMDRPADELKRRWQFLRDGMPRQGGDSVKRAKHVSFSDPLVTGGNSRWNPDARDTAAQLAADDNALLHKIAAKWERDRWFAISTRFNDKTVRHITPDDAASILAG